MEKEQGQTRNPLRHKGFPICLYYDIRAYVRYGSPAKRSGYQDRLRDAGPLQRGLHPGHLRPRHRGHAERGRGPDGQLYRPEPLKNI